MTVDHHARPKLDFRNRLAGLMFRPVNPLARRLIAAGVPTGAPNVLLTVRGRRSGKLRTVPVGMMEFEGAWYVQANFGETGWVANLRANGEATVTHRGGGRVAVRGRELSPEEAGAVLQRALGPFRRSRVLRALMGRHARPPIGILWGWRIRLDDSLEEFVAGARRHPLFELRPVAGEADPDRRQPEAPVA